MTHVSCPGDKMYVLYEAPHRNVDPPQGCQESDETENRIPDLLLMEYCQLATTTIRLDNTRKSQSRPSKKHNPERILREEEIEIV
ncbi:hypothetical protein Pmani_038578 [Petrolisthes manimaculis]|uniref:Uncharacterized protein n=1 Tax=Petrolisthes manimaculis TaxID=1843537 RepID=A0AAE1NFW4_9EUCA|nr:hypothetical protein Pmani_038578 [Petrolisthes manimaculis]